MTGRHVIVAGVVVIAALFAGSSGVRAQTGDVRVFASNGFRAVFDELGPACERSIGRVVTAQFGTSTSLKQRVDAGDPFDVAIMTAEAIDELAKAGKLALPTRTALGRSGIGIGNKAGSQKPAIATADDLKKTLLAAKSVTYAGDGASRPHIERMMSTLGIDAQMAKKTLLEQGSVRAAEKVASGEAELLITLMSEILPAPGVQVVGPLPKQFQNYVSFAAAAGARAPSADAAKALIACLSGPNVLSTMKGKGMEK
jgi:molybdate transport system substrate-binding protein